MGELPEDSPTINSSLASLTIGDHLPEKLRLSCFHTADAESIRAELGKPMERDIMAFYDEAIRRLPVADMPDLVDCVLTGGHCIGLLDPVSNIIFNALNLRCRRMCTKKREGKKKVPSLSSKGEVEQSYRWVTIVFRSYNGLIAFVQTYFRYLSTGQAMRYLRVAGADLAVAVQIGEHQHFGLEGRQTPDLCCGRTQYALKAAAAKAEHPEPDDLALLAKSLTPFQDQKPLAAVLQKGRLLSVEDVNGVLDSLKRLHYAASPAVQVSFTRRPHPDFDQQPSKFSCVIDENYIAEVVITRYDGPISSICDLRTTDEMKQMLVNCLDSAATTIGNCCPSHTSPNPATAPPSPDTTKCEHINYLKKCLLDAIHAFYIEVLSLLPHKSLHKHLRGILVAGHCYGPLDPVSNIILNAFWYDAHFPLLGMDAEFEPDIMDSKSVLRVEVRSLDGLVAMFCTATGLSEHDAVEYLCHKQCDLSVVLQMTSKEICFKAYERAGQAGKHPKHSDLASFLVSMYGADVHGLLRASLTNDGKTKGYVISDASLELVHKVVGGQSSLTVPSVDRPRLSPMGWKMLASRKGDFVQKQGFLRKILEKLLLDYSNQHPWEPMMHRLDVICGVKGTNYEHSKCYHLNFLAYCDDASSNAISTTGVLFFAEVWGPKKTKLSELDTSVKMVPVPCTANVHCTDSNSHAKIYCKSGQVKSRTSFCCPLPYYNVDHPYLGRCANCEPSSNKIAHPPSGNHAGAKCSAIGASVDYLNFAEPTSSVDCITDSDFMYFDCLRDVKFAEILNAKPSSETKQPTIP